MILSAALVGLELALAVSVRPATITFYRAGIRSLIRYLGDVPVGHVDRVALLQWYGWLAAEGYSERSIAGYTKGVKRLFDWLHDEGHIAVNPAAVLKVRQKERSTVRAISEADYRALRVAARPDARLHLFILLLADTGARISEIVEIRLDDVVLDHERQRGRVVVNGKTGERVVRFGGEVYRELSSYLLFNHPGGEWLFVSRQTGRPLLPNSIRHAIYQVAKKAGIRGRVNPHAFRHRFARIYLQRGGDMASLSRLLGHSSVTITLKYYVHWTDTELDDLHEAANPAHSPIDKKSR